MRPHHSYQLIVGRWFSCQQIGFSHRIATSPRAMGALELRRWDTTLPSSCFNTRRLMHLASLPRQTLCSILHSTRPLPVVKAITFQGEPCDPWPLRTANAWSTQCCFDNHRRPNFLRYRYADIHIFVEDIPVSNLVSCLSSFGHVIFASTRRSPPEPSRLVYIVGLPSYTDSHRSRKSAVEDLKAFLFFYYSLQLYH